MKAESDCGEVVRTAGDGRAVRDGEQQDGPPLAGSCEKPVLRGRLTLLVPTREGDLDLLAGWFADPEFVANWGGVPLSRAVVAAKYVGRRRPEVESFLVLDPGGPVGYAQYWSAGAAEGGLDMVLTSGARGRGLGPDAAGALVRHVCGTLGWERVTVDPAAANVRAVRAWEKAGFRRVSGDGGGAGSPVGDEDGNRPGISAGENLLLEYRAG